MRLVSRSLLVCVLGVVLGCFSQTVAAVAAESYGEEALSPGDSLAGAPLVVGSADRLFLGGEEGQAAREATRSNPEAVAAREASLTSFEGLAPSQAASEARAAFPDLIEHPASGVPQLPSGQRIVSYVTDNAAQVSLPGGIGVIESLAPIAARTTHGRHVPLDLRLRESNGGFEPVLSDAGVDVPKDLSNGVSLSGVGVSLTPVNEHGSPLAASAGALEGSAVVWGDSEDAAAGVHDLATVAKPSPAGFDLTTMLLSRRSSGELYFRVGMPSGAHLESVDGGSARVVKNGVSLAIVSPVSAQDAEGSDVPVSMGVHGDVLELTVDLAGDYLYPIAVDPEVNDGQLATTSGGKRSNWVFETNAPSKYAHSAVNEGSKEHLETTGIAEYEPGQVAFWRYRTKGVSKIYGITTVTSAKNKNAEIESFLAFVKPPVGEEETKKILSTKSLEPEYENKSAGLCAANGVKKEETVCLPNFGTAGNSVQFQQSPTAKPGSNYKFSDTLSQATVSISEPTGTHSTTSFNTTPSEFEFEVENEKKEKEKIKRKNALHSPVSWLSKFGGALEMVAKDTGIGVSATKLEYESSPGKWEPLSEHSYLEKENACEGVQCYETHAEFWTLDPKLPDGEDTIRYKAEEAMSGTQSLETEGKATIKVDTKASHNISLKGLPYGNELSEKSYELTGEATDGEGSTIASSGIKSIALFIDGHEFGTASGSCTKSKGECTGTAHWTINGAELGAGHHAIVVVALDNAGNEARLSETLSIRHSTPVALGPGSVDLESGDFALSAGDVSLGSGLTLARNYSSRDTTAGDEGPLGPEWSLSMGSTESLTEMVDGSILMTAGDGKQTIFASLGAGKFESPTGDSNLELSLEENKETKQKLAYYLKNAAAHTSVKFTLPSGGAKVWMPTKQEGTVATDTVTYAYRTVEQYNEYLVKHTTETEPPNPEGIAAGPDGDVWLVEFFGNAVAKVNPTGAVTRYSLPTYKQPSRITLGPDGNMWFTEDDGNKIGKITTSGTITEYALPTGGTPKGITTGPDGNVWFTQYEASKIGRITTSGTVTEYSLPEHSGPWGIASGPDGNLWYTNLNSSKIGKITTSGTITEYALPASSAPNSITVGSDHNLWFTEKTDKIGKITTSGTVTEYTLPSGSVRPVGITTGPDGDAWFTDREADKIGKMTTSGVATEYTLPTGSKPESIVAGPDGNMWFTENLYSHSSSKVGVMPTSGTITEPTEELAPAPAGVSCSPELKPGCRALKFQYATETTATGEKSSEWGQFKGRLTKAMFDGYNPVSKAMQETAVAEYSYDTLGRLRAKWDPRVSPALKTTYGYDEEGHVTALTSPGQESWAFTYGAISGDLGTGRLLKVAQAPASAELWKGEQVANTEAPKVTGATGEGMGLAVSNGTWSGSPVGYGYQWEECSPSGACKPIPGATNPTYTLKSGDVGDTIIAKVSATSGGGSVVAASAATAVVQAVSSSQLTEYALPAGSSPFGITAGPDGNVWFTDTTSGKVGKITSGGTITEYAAEGTEPENITSGSDGNLWFVDHGSARVNRMTTSGAFTKYLVPRVAALNVGIVKGPDNNLWYTESGKDYIGKINTSGEILAEYKLATGSSPYGITVGSDGKLWFVDHGTGKIGTISTSGTITEYELGFTGGSELYAITNGPDGNLWFTISGTNRIGKISTSGSFGSLTQDNLPSGSKPRGIAAGPDGNLWFTDYGTNKVGKVSTSGVVAEAALPSGSAPIAIAAGPDGNMWYTASGTNKIGKVALTGGETRSPQPGSAIEYGVPLEGSAAPYQMGVNGTTHKPEPEKWGQSDDPAEATAIFAQDEPQGWPASSYKRATVYYLDEQGRQVNVASPSTSTYGSIATTEYNAFNDPIRSLSADNRATALAGENSAAVSKLLDTQSTYNGEGAKEGEVEEPGTRLIDTVGPQHEVKYVAGAEEKESLARLHTKLFYDEGAPGGETYDLVTKATKLAQLANEEEVEVRKTTTSYSGQSNLGWKLRAPTSVTDDPEGKKITHTTLYNATTAQITETRGPGGSGGESAHDQRVIYYSAEANTEGFAACGSHPEWVGLVCETLPAKQPEGGGAQKLPVTTMVYNIWNEPTTTTETFGSTVRTKTSTYDEAGRLTGSETTSTVDTALPKVTNEYSSTTGVLEKQKTTVEGTTKTITSKYNTVGQMTEYTDVDGNTAKYKYAGPENDGLLEEMTDGSAAGTGKQTYTYNTTTKLMEKLTDSSAETFTASYDAEGKLTSEVYPNGMCANNTYNSVGEATHLEYIKTTNCSEHEPTVWFSETRSPSVRGETFNRTSTLASENYAYDTLGRLTEAQETPAGEGCKTNLYAYDVESNRTSQTARTPGSGGKCATEGGTVQEHTYDEANHLTDTGIAYDSFGNVTKLPASDAEGHELASTYYVDNAVASQSQNGVTNNYYLDPTGRVRETVSGVKTTITHYDASGEAVAWTSEGEGKSTRNIPGIDGTLTAIQTNAETPILQLHDLQGNIVATAALSSSETKLLSTYNSTEFGVPNGGKAPPKYAWLGAGGVASAFSSGVITYGATSYVPQTGRVLQSEQVEPPGLPGGSGAGAAYTAQEEPWNMQGAAREGAEAPGLEAARELAAEEAALRAAVAAGGEDPPAYLFKNKALALGEKFNKIDTWSEVWDGIFGLLGLADPISWVEGAVVGALSLTVMENWLHATGDKLERCGRIHEKYFIMCKLTYDTLLNGNFVDPFDESEIRKCGTVIYYVKFLAHERWECLRLTQ